MVFEIPKKHEGTKKMRTCPFCGSTHNVGFISTRFAGTDGVSLETAKWADVFQKEGFSCFYFAGELDRPPDHSYLDRVLRGRAGMACPS